MHLRNGHRRGDPLDDRVACFITRSVPSALTCNPWRASCAPRRSSHRRRAGHAESEAQWRGLCGTLAHCKRNGIIQGHRPSLGPRGLKGRGVELLARGGHVALDLKLVPCLKTQAHRF